MDTAALRMPYCEIFLLQVTAEPQRRRQPRGGGGGGKGEAGSRMRGAGGRDTHSQSAVGLGTGDWGALSPLQNLKRNQDLTRWMSLPPPPPPARAGGPHRLRMSLQSPCLGACVPPGGLALGAVLRGDRRSLRSGLAEPWGRSRSLAALLPGGGAFILWGLPR